MSIIKQFNSFEEFCTFFQIQDIVNESIFIESVTHSSIKNKANYERLEFLGDSILNFIITKLLFHLLKQDNEGILAKKRAFLISREICTKIAYSIHLDDVIKMSNSEKKNSTLNNKSILACVMESFLAAIYLLYGENKTTDIIKYLFGFYLNEYEEDYKMKLQELSQKYFNKLPIYELISQDGEMHNPTFKVKVTVDECCTVGVGKNKKDAEKKAAHEMLNIINCKKN